MKNDKKKEISRRFSKAATTYDEFALVQKACGVELAASLIEECQASSILEIGCGTGNYTRLLVNRFPKATIHALDFAYGMVAQAKTKFADDDGAVHFSCEDGEKFLAESKHAYDLITSNATMQWFDDLNGAFANIAGSLSNSGKVQVSFFGPETLHELGQGMLDLFDEPVSLAAAQFHGKEEITEMAARCFGEVNVVETCYQRRYTSLRELLQYIRKTGTGGYHQNLPILTRSRLKQLAAWFANHGGFAVTYQVFFVSAVKKGE